MAKNNNLTDFLTDTANAIRTKKGTTGKINPQDFSSEIASIQTGVDTSDATATANDILLGKTAYANGSKITGTIETYAGDGSETVNKLAALVDGTLTEITAEDLAGVTKIRDHAFDYYSIITSIDIPDSVMSIGTYAFRECKVLKNVIIPNSVTSISNGAFNSCYAFTSIIIPNSVTSLGNGVFYNCSKLSNIKIQDGLIKIDDYMFYGCSSLTSIIIPSAVKSIGYRSLQIGSTNNKATITMLPTTPPTIQSSTFDTSYLQKIIVPAGTGATYKAATNWSTFADYIEEATA